jgi:hypothetical protein
MSIVQREQFFNHVRKCDGFDLEKEQCRHFYARFNPRNQFIITAFSKCRAGEHECFLFENQFRIAKNTFINRDYITKIVRVYDGTEFSKTDFI